ncbi:MAG: DUF4912 domain-containing protein [Candidatus Krumholzibacteria bacterium]|nr:DUF4912 domain-containing protein [Candidatus Krumholzibacteria bacterium]
MIPKELKKRKAASVAAKPKTKPKKTSISDNQKRVDAAKEAARRFIAGVRETPRAAKKAPAKPAKKVERPAAAPPAAARFVPALPMTARPAAPKPAESKPAAPKVAAPKPAPPTASPKTGKAKIRIKPAKAAKALRPAGKKPATRKSAEPEKAAHEPIRQAAEEGKFYLGAEQRVMPPVEAIEIPKGYNVDRIVAMVRDPHWLFAYWEVTDRKYRELERTFGSSWASCKMILRVYDKSSGKQGHFDIVLTREARTWYINVSAQGRYQVAIGALSPDGRFELVAISSIVETPADRVSDRIDEQWMVPDDVFNRIFAASGGYDMHSASGELKGLLEKRLLEEISSGAVTSFGSGALYAEAKGRSFRLWVATELILYGGTEPDARVTVQGKELKLRPDGTFSLRFALPDGKIELPVTAVSGDKIEERTIETNVTKKSLKKEPVLK